MNIQRTLRWLPFHILVAAVAGRMAGTIGIAEEMGEVVSHLLSSMGSCQMILVTANDVSFIMKPTIRYLSQSNIAVISLDAANFLKHPEDRFSERFLASLSHTCKALFFDLTFNSNKTTLTMIDTFLDNIEVSDDSDIFVLAVGSQKKMNDFFQYPSLRNTVQALYLALDDSVLDFLHAEHRQSINGEVSLFSRCLYCGNGEAQIELVQQWDLQSGFPENYKAKKGNIMDYMGHEFKIVALEYFPFVNFTTVSTGQDSFLQLQDSVDQRMLDAFAQHLNFTYKVKPPSDGTWGIPIENGIWNGIVGTLQEELSDFSLVLTTTYERHHVIDFARVYFGEPLAIISRKPQLLPNYLSLIRPLSEIVWMILLVTVVTASLAVWLLRKAWSLATGGQSLSLTSTFLDNWGTMLDNAPSQTPTTTSARVMVMTWLLYCLVITTAYRSSLVAYLTVQGKTPVIDSFEDLLKYNGWSWGMHNKAGAYRLYMTSRSDRVIQELVKTMQYHSTGNNMRLVLKGNYAFFGTKHYISALIAKNYTDESGFTNIYLSKTEYNPYAGVAWGFRKGIPIRQDITKLTQKLMEAGLVDQWKKEVINVPDNGKKATGENNGSKTSLNIEHLLPAFILVVLGLGMSVITFIIEIVIARFTQS